MTTPAVAPYVATYANRTPYITADEFLNAPTGVDVSQIKPGASPSENRAALSQLILRASSEADTICRKVLAATVDMKVGQFRVRRDGSIRVPVDYTPLVAVNAVKVGPSATNLVTLTDLTGLWLQRKVVHIPVFAANYSPFGTTPSALADTGRVFAQVTYVNGYANTTLYAAALANANSLTPQSVVGIFPGLTMTVYDATAANWEQVTVADTYATGAAVVPLTAPLAFAHAAGTSISAFPGFVKEAVINLTAFLIKKRGAEAIAMDGYGTEPSHTLSAESGGLEEYDWAVDLLEPERRVW